MVTLFYSLYVNDPLALRLALYNKKDSKNEQYMKRNPPSMMYSEN